MRCRGLRKAFGGTLAVDGIGFDVAPGEIYGLLGPNGAGKTTTVSMVCGLLRPDAGEVVVNGVRLDGGGRAARRAIGYAPQELALYPELTAEENLRFFGRLYGLRGAELARRVDRVLGLVGLQDRAGQRVEEYSGGMKRRLNFAAALVGGPTLLVLDEPTLGVDAHSRLAILSCVGDLAARGTGVLYTTHHLEEAEQLCHRVGIIDRGRMLAEGTSRQLAERFGHLDRVEVRGSGPLEALAAGAVALDGVEQAACSQGAVHLLVRGARGLLPRVLEAADRAGVAVDAVEVREADLEAVFLGLTGTALRD